MSDSLRASFIFALYLLLACSVAFILIRLLRGPSLPDRIVALDMIAMVGVAFLAVDALQHGDAVFLSPAMVLSIISFVGTVAVAWYLERRRRRTSP